MTADWEPLRVGEQELSDDELLWRVAGSHAVDAAGQPIPALFRLTAADAGCLSVARSTRTTAAAAVAHREAVTGKTQVGAWAVTVHEVLGLTLRTIDDSGTQPPPTSPGHSYIDKRPLLADKAAVNAIRSELLTLAVRHAQQRRVFIA